MCVCMYACVCVCMRVCVCEGGGFVKEGHHPLPHANANVNSLAAARRSRAPGRARMPVH